MRSIKPRATVSHKIMKTNAILSPDRKYRYCLTREWDSSKPNLVYILLNPSTADETINDPTISRCIDIAKYNGFGSIKVMNLFAYRATQPPDMKCQCDPVGPENDKYLLEETKDSIILLAWGNHGNFMNRSAAVVTLLQDKELFCLAKNKSGEPKHPLYIKTETKLHPFR